MSQKLLGFCFSILYSLTLLKMCNYMSPCWSWRLTHLGQQVCISRGGHSRGVHLRIAEILGIFHPFWWPKIWNFKKETHDEVTLAASSWMYGSNFLWRLERALPFKAALGDGFADSRQTWPALTRYLLISHCSETKPREAQQETKSCN